MADRRGGVEVEVTPLGYGRYQVKDATGRRIAFAVASSDTWVFLDGRVYVVPSGTASYAAGVRIRTDQLEELRAPMPATVLAIHATPGQRVRRDEVLVVLEAMKMELPLRAPRDGRVREIACQPGDLVQAGTMLLQLDQDPESVDANGGGSGGT